MKTKRCRLAGAAEQLPQSPTDGISQEVRLLTERDGKVTALSQDKLVVGLECVANAERDAVPEALKLREGKLV